MGMGACVGGCVVGVCVCVWVGGCGCVCCGCVGVFHSLYITSPILQRAGLAGTDGARVLGAQAHQRMVTSMKKELATKERRIEEVFVIF